VGQAEHLRLLAGAAGVLEEDGIAPLKHAIYSLILHQSQIIRRLTFFTLSLTTRLIQKNYTNIVKFKSFLKNFY
jgi:hypothetical protein